MFDLIKKTILTGVGLTAMTRDKIEELAKELTEKGEMSEKEGKELVEELIKKSERVGKDLETNVENIVQKVLEKIDVATKKDIAGLEKKIKRLEQKETTGNKGGMSE
jgi:polyhydroxyalkanoate synthesis regulator phasin